MVADMRSRLFRLLLTGLAVGGLALTAGTLSAAAQTAKPPAKAKPAAAPAPPPPPPPDPDNQVKTSDEVKRESVQGAATAPLRDLNVLKTKIPEILLQSLTDPYARPPPKWKCPQLAALINPLDEALGPDIDRVLPGDENLMDRSKSTALGVGADLASGMIPFRGVLRRVSGAEAHDKLVQSAIIAGNVRRAYLKGLGEARGCMPPATPSHERAGSMPAADKQHPLPKPLYPTRRPAAPQTSAENAQGAAPR
jgi:hypothetical protein